eukprot:scaffold79048_cov17-Prasinocladus_malaysianus.AAC.1
MATKNCAAGYNSIHSKRNQTRALRFSSVPINLFQRDYNQCKLLFDATKSASVELNMTRIDSI